MKIALISLFLCLSVFGQFGLRSPEFVSKLSQKAASSASDVPAGSLLSEDFEGTGAPSGWGSSGAVNFDETGTVLYGSQSLSIDATASSPYCYKAFTGQSQVQFFFDFQFHSVPGSTGRFAEFDNSGYSTLGYLNLTSAAKLQLEPVGGTVTTGTAILSADTRYRIWIRYTKGSGSNASLEVWVSPTDSKADAVDHFSVSNGTATTDAAFLWLQPQSGLGLLYYDRVRVDAF